MLYTLPVVQGYSVRCYSICSDMRPWEEEGGGYLLQFQVVDANPKPTVLYQVQVYKQDRAFKPPMFSVTKLIVP